MQDRPGECLEGVDSSQQDIPEVSQAEEEDEPLVEVLFNVDEEGNVEPESEPDRESDEPQLALPLGVASTSREVPKDVSSSGSTTPARRRSVTPNKKRTGQLHAAIGEVKETVERAMAMLQVQRDDDAFLDKLLKGQEKMLTQCTQQLIEGLKSCLKKKQETQIFFIFFIIFIR